MFLINILLVDDHALFSKSLEIALSDYSEIETFDSINDVSQLDNFIVSKKPDIILMDINLKNISSEDGLELAKQILSCYPEVKEEKSEQKDLLIKILNLKSSYLFFLK